MPAAIKHTKTTSSRSALLILIVANFSSRSSRYNETGIANLVVWPDLYEKQRRIVLTATMLGLQGVMQREGDVIHLICARLFDLTPMLASLGERGPDRSDGALRLKSRNFH